eukprot:s2944_g5.t1
MPGLHDRILAPALPLLVPFFAGMPGSREQPPPLARLSTPGSQQLAASVLPHFPRLKPALLTVLVDVVCRWSEAMGSGSSSSPGCVQTRCLRFRRCAGAAARGSAEMMPHLSQECSEQLLEACLRGRAAQREELLVPRLRAAMAVLKVVPDTQPTSDAGAARCEQCALKLASVIAAWVRLPLARTPLLTRLFSSPCASTATTSAEDLPSRALPAWPIALQAREGQAPHSISRLSMCIANLAARGLSFFFLCASRLPQASRAGGASTASAGCHFLREIFDVLVVRHGAAAITSNALLLPQHPLVGRSAHAAELFVIATLPDLSVELQGTSSTPL